MRLVPTTLAASLASARVCFLTDIEGNWQYVRRVVRQSSCLRFRDPQERELELADDSSVLVFGGDAGDKGPDTLHCYEQLVRLKRRHPERVVLLVGNRDVNKMRLTSELADAELPLGTMADEIRDGPQWVPADKRTTLPMFLEQRVRDTCDDDANAALTAVAAATAGDALMTAIDVVNTKANRLRWMLDCTMGSAGEFERRREELQQRRRATNLGDHDLAAGIDRANDDDNDDDAVVRSFLSSVEPGGVLREYLELGCLAFIAHGTLFVHGGLMNPRSSDQEAVPTSLGRIPEDPESYADVVDWATRLNAWYARQVQAWIDAPTWSRDHRTRGGEALLDYVLPTHDHSVVMGRHLDSAGMPVPLPLSLAERLTASGIRRVLVGHTPHGTCPTMITQPPTETSTFEGVIMCDTSYSDMGTPDNRGIAASEVVLHSDGVVHVHGVLENGRGIHYTSMDPVVGRLLRDGTRVKARLTPQDDGDQDHESFLTFHVRNGFSYTYMYRTGTEIAEIGFAEEDHHHDAAKVCKAQ